MQDKKTGRSKSWCTANPYSNDCLSKRFPPLQLYFSDWFHVCLYHMQTASLGVLPSFGSAVSFQEQENVVSWNTELSEL